MIIIIIQELININTKELELKVRDLLHSGKKIIEISKELNISREAVYLILNNASLEQAMIKLRQSN